MSAADRCLICYQECSPRRRKENDYEEFPMCSLISQELHVMFILRNIFEVPREAIQEYLEIGTNPSEWISVCDACSRNLVEKAKRIYKEILDAKRRFRKVKGDIIQYLRKNTRRVQQDEKNKVGTTSRRDGMMMTDNTRIFVSEHNYSESLVDPFVGGDCQAAQLLFSGNVAIEVDDDIPSPVHHDNDINVKIECDSNDDAYDEDGPEPVSPPESNCSLKEESVQRSETCVRRTSNRKIRRKEKEPDSCIHKANGSVEKSNGDFDWFCTCGRTYTGILQLRRHLKEAIMGPKEMYSCQVCGKQFKRGWDVRRHLKSHEGELEGRSEKMKKISSIKLKEKMEEDEQDQEDYQTPFSPKALSITNTVSLRHERNDVSKMADGTEFWKCSCGKLYLTEDNLIQHVEEGNKALPVVSSIKITCDICDNTFKRRFELNQHMKKVHGMEKPATADNPNDTQANSVDDTEGHENVETPSTPATPSTMIDENRHLKHDETVMESDEHEELGLFGNDDGATQWRCKCGKSYASQGALHRHVREKTMDPGIKYPCTLCEKTFHRKGLVKRHMSMVHEKTTVSCDKCGKTFSLKTNLRMHQVNCSQKLPEGN